MDAARFDALARSLQRLAPRRVALAALGGGLSALLAITSIPDAEAGKKKGKKKKKCKKKCNECQTCNKKKGKCQAKPNGTACSIGGATCQSGACVCEAGFFPCNGECIEENLCCVDADCGGEILSCDDGICTCPDPSDFPCSISECCDPASEVCAVDPVNTTAACQGGGCPATDWCSDDDFFVCQPGCNCVTSVEGQNACSDFYGGCSECTTDQECSDELDEPGVCMPSGTFCDCPGNVCVAAQCLEPQMSAGTAERRAGRGRLAFQSRERGRRSR